MPRGAPGQGFSRRHRFTGQGSFGAILRNSRKLRSRYAVAHLAPGPAGASRLGIALTRRLVPSSVHRNRLKRCVREVFRMHAVKRAGLDIVVALRERFEPREEASIVAEIRGLFDLVSAGGMR